MHILAAKLLNDIVAQQMYETSMRFELLAAHNSLPLPFGRKRFVMRHVSDQNRNTVNAQSEGLLLIAATRFSDRRNMMSLIRWVGFGPKRLPKSR